ncbi:MAG: polyphosphate kinase 1 [Dehalococcoidia bacterium]
MVETAEPIVPEVMAPPSGPRYFTRELSLLQWCERTLDQARPAMHPLLERVKFLAFSDFNLDEFLSIHFADLLGKAEEGSRELTPDGLTQTEQIRRVRAALAAFMAEQRRVFDEELVPELAAGGIHFRRYADLTAAPRRRLHELFMSDVFPVCTPLAVDSAHPFPFISNMSINLGIVLWDAKDGTSFARIKVPNVLPRLMPTPNGRTSDRDIAFVWLEDVIANNLDAFFPGVEVREVCVFRIVRDADIELRQLEAADDLREEVQAGVRRRRFGETVCVQLEAPLPEAVAQQLITRLDVYPEDVYVTGGPLGMRDLFQLIDLDRPDLEDLPLIPRVPAQIAAATDLFALIRQRDLLLHHPYESFKPVYDFIEQAAADPQVLAIKQTLYRVGRQSPIVQSLLDAVDRGKQVAVVLELQARGDEENNIEWAGALERAGAHVSYGVIGLKTHAKVALVIRREADGIRRYVHFGTGNYNNNPYADLSLFTCRPELGADATELFNVLTGHSHQEEYARLLVAPVSVRAGITAAISTEVERHQRDGGGLIIFKTNALTDLDMVDTLYRASQAGVRVELLVRGMCCVRPGVPGMSENIRVRSIAGRFLEHSRVYYFHNGGDERVFIGSADLMPRNLNRRVETLVPVLDAGLRRALKENLLDVQLADTVRAIELHPDGAYRPIRPADGARPFDSQLAWAAGGLSLMRG